jgi:hypothetical protein
VTGFRQRFDVVLVDILQIIQDIRAGIVEPRIPLGYEGAGLDCSLEGGQRF